MRIRSIIVVLSMMFLTMNAFCQATDYDFSSMPFDELSSLKEAVDKEYIMRNEAYPLILTEGSYIVGNDILEGTYRIIGTQLSADGHTPEAYLYESEEQYNQRPVGKLGEYSQWLYLSIGDKSKELILSKGNVFYIRDGEVAISTTNITMNDIYNFTQPEGTLIPYGVYTIGVDIPAGVYRIYAGTVDGGRIYVYNTTEKYIKDSDSYHMDRDNGIWVYYSDQLEFETVLFADGQILVVDKACVFTKQPKLVFH